MTNILSFFLVEDGFDQVVENRQLFIVLEKFTVKHLRKNPALLGQKPIDVYVDSVLANEFYDLYVI